MESKFSNGLLKTMIKGKLGEYLSGKTEIELKELENAAENTINGLQIIKKYCPQELLGNIELTENFSKAFKEVLHDKIVYGNVSSRKGDVMKNGT